MVRAGRGGDGLCSAAQVQGSRQVSLQGTGRLRGATDLGRWELMGKKFLNSMNIVSLNPTYAARTVL